MLNVVENVNKAAKDRMVGNAETKSQFLIVQVNKLVEVLQGIVSIMF